MVEAVANLGVALANSLDQVTWEKCADISLHHAELNKQHIKHDIFELQKSKLMEGDSAIVIAAGPSLHRHHTADAIREAKYKGVLIATESAMSYCLRHDLVPDMVVTLDPHPKRIVRWFGDPDLKQADLDADDYYRRQDLDPKFSKEELKTNAELLAITDKYGPQICAAVASSASPSVVNRCMQAGMPLYWWNPLYDDYDQPGSLTQKLYDMNGLPCLNAGGNVGTAAWTIAHSVLEKKNVAVVGMDFGYYGDTDYSQTQYYYELIDLVGKDRLDQAYIHLENPEIPGDWYTDPTYFWYREAFLSLAKEAPCRTFNCTGGGILFGEGVEIMPLERFLKL